MEKAFEVSLEGGLLPKVSNPTFRVELENGLVIFSSNNKSINMSIPSIFLTPAFWKSLSKGANWQPFRCLCGVYYAKQPEKCSNCGKSKLKESWLTNWLRFIEWTADEKDQSLFFEEILTN